jgi:hypothetical protein
MLKERRFVERRFAESRIEVTWFCRPCEVEGQDAQKESIPTCWNCGGPVVVTARPTVRPSPRPDAAV